ncbi:large ribosomal subunit protein mL62 [Aulostomus maculatus]
MAAHIARRCCLLCSNVSAGISAISRPGKQRSCRIQCNNSTFQLSAAYGSHNTKQGSKVHIPVDRLTVSYSRSSGPGGQHVNKVSSKAEVRFHVYTADWIPEDVRQKIVEKNRNRITKAGELLVTSERSRSQQRNLNDCVEKISAIIAEASVKPHEPTPEEIALREARLHKSNMERLKNKKIKSAMKQSRRVDFD